MNVIFQQFLWCFLLCSKIQIVLCPSDGLRQQFQCVIIFLYFILNQKSIELNNVGHIGPHRIFWRGNLFLYKNLHIEPFNHAIKSVCFDFRSTNVGSSIIRTGLSSTLSTGFDAFIL